MTPWSDEDDAKLREMIADRKTASQAAALLGRSRSSCIGRAFRLGLGFRSGVRTSKTVKPKTRIALPSLPAAPITEPAATGSPDGCKWIHGDVQAGGWTYCGHDVRPDTAWCPHHFARVYQAGSALKSHQRANDAKRRQWLRRTA